MVLNLCTSSYDTLFFVLSLVKISQRVSKFFSRQDFQTEIFEGEKFHKNANGVMILVLCTSPDDALYFYQVP